MGGDNAPKEIIAGARRAQEELGIEVILVGEASIAHECSGLEFMEASQTIAMDEDPGVAVRTKKDSSLVRIAELVRDGKASAMVSAGNTGATMASALLKMGRLKGIARPAIATPIPVASSGYSILLDAGANAECKPEWLVQFAQMGSEYAKSRFGVENPRVGLLSIGEEPTKGTPFVKEAHQLLCKASGIDFIGNVEGRDIMGGAADVVVTDGFTGNVALKSLEGAVKFMIGEIFGAFGSSDEVKEAAKVLMPALTPLANRLDPELTGGAMLLGTKGVCIISHGSSSSVAIVSALTVAKEMVKIDLVSRLAQATS